MSETDALFRRLVQDLDRCQHGRHSADPCYMCPGSQSAGNQLIPPGTLIGTGLHDRIVVPPNDQRHDPAAWRLPNGEVWKQMALSAAHSQSLMRLGAAALEFHTLRGTTDSHHVLMAALDEHLRQFPAQP